MYDELLKRLRSEAIYLPEKFSKNAELLDVLMKAADAIEELSKRVPPVPHGALIDRDDFFATCPELVDGYKTITDDLVVIPAEEGE